MSRVALAVLVALTVLLGLACGSTESPGVILHASPRSVRFTSACASIDCGSRSINFTWSKIPFPATTGYNMFVCQGDGCTPAQFDTSSGSPYTYTGMDCGTTFTLGVQAHDSGGGTSQVYTTGYVTPSCGAVPLLVGIDGWGGGNASDQVSLGSPTVGSNGVVRADQEGSGTLNGSTSASQFYNAGGEVIFLISGCNNACASNGALTGYSSNGVADITAATWGTNAVSLFASRCGGSSTNCPAVEVLNEPCIFWGAHCNQTSANRYAQILQATYTDFHATYGASAPKILASYDGGESNPTSTTWGQDTVSNGVSVTVSNYVDDWTIHAYGGYNNTCSTADVDCASNGARGSILSTASTTGKPVWVTEVGWPTNCSSGCPSATGETGDSLQWNTTQEADNIYNLITWARGKGTSVVAEVNVYEYRDETGNALYGVTTAAAANKAAYTAIKQAAQGIACTVC